MKYKKHILNAMICLTGITAAPLTGFESKWDRVMDLGKAIKDGSIAGRLENKNRIVDILLSQEDGYPVYYVSQSAAGTGDGLSWENAFTDVQPAIEAAATAEGWVWVAAGEYTGTYPYGDAAVKLRSRVILLGGFSGTESRIEQRNFDANITILKGWRGRRAVDMEHCSMIDGFHIRKSGYKNTESLNATDVAGGGIRSMATFTLIRNNRIYDNNAKDGGGLVIWGRKPWHRLPEYTSIIENNVIYDNYGVCGAGVTIRNSEVLFNNNIVAYNYHERRAKGLEIIIDKDVCEGPVVVNNILWHNSTNVWGSQEGLNFGDLYNHVEHDGRARSFYNCIQSGKYGEGSISDDPMFKDPENWDFTLLPGSPCINTGLPDAPLDPDSSRSDMGLYTPQRYQVDMRSAHPSIPAPSGSGQYQHGQPIHLTADSLIIDAQGTTRYRFSHWTGTGSGSYTGTQAAIILTAAGPVTQTAHWRTEHWLTIQDDSLAQSSRWYVHGDSVCIPIPLQRAVNSDYRQTLMSWTLESDTLLTGSDSLCSFRIMSPAVLTPIWQAEYKISTVSIPAYGGSITLQPAGIWFAEHDSITLNAMPRDDQFVFSHWNQDTTLTESELEITVTQAHQITARFDSADTMQSRVQNAVKTPLSFELRGVFPNPFNHAASIAYTLPEPGLVEIRIFNITGHQVYQTNKIEPRGHHTLIWEGRNQSRQIVASGTYIVQVAFKGHYARHKLLFVQ